MIVKNYPFTGEAAALAAFLGREEKLFLLESSLRHAERGRYSFLGFDPFDTWRGRGSAALDELRQKFAHFVSYFPSPPVDIPFPAGAVGYLAYDMGIPGDPATRRTGRRTMPDGYFAFYDRVLVVDHYARQLLVISTGMPETDRARQQRRARERFQEIEQKVRAFLANGHRQQLSGMDTVAIVPAAGRFRLSVNFSRPDYLNAVRRAQAYIADGEIYQVNLSQRFCLHVTPASAMRSPLELYRVLRALSPASFSAYLDAGPFQIVSSSPERFLCMRGRRIQARPMKGTRPRGDSRQEDQRLRTELQKSAKDRAELLMITDLLRNDLGRVCDFGSVRTKQLRCLERYATVFQTTATVEGHLRDGCDAFDVLNATFPGGSITGCPKIRSMEIIRELEPEGRALYTGSCGYISFTGDMDMNILIRTLWQKKNHLYFQSGGGIVADSVPEQEYEETLVKTQAMVSGIARVYDAYPGVMPAEMAGASDDVVFLDGRLRAVNAAYQRGITPGHSRATGAFETMRARQGLIPFLPAHFKRLWRGLRRLGMAQPLTSASMRQAIHDVLAAKQLLKGDARVRVVCWRNRKQVHTAVTAAASRLVSGPAYERGWRLGIMSRPLPPAKRLGLLKSLRYQTFARAWEEACAAGWDEGLWVTSRKEVIEGTRSNTFWVRKGVLYTPPLASGCLAGITRNVIIQIARQKSLKVMEVWAPVTDVARAEEIFVTNAVIGVMPVTWFAGNPVGKGVPARITRLMTVAYEAAVRDDINRTGQM